MASCPQGFGLGFGGGVPGGEIGCYGEGGVAVD
jgi:hypothetical protein